MCYCCPACGSMKFPPYKCVPYPMHANEEGTESVYGLASQGKNGVACCSWDEGDYATLEEAKTAAEGLDMEEFAAERREEAAAFDDYDDYGPPDSDPYDIDGPYF